MLVGGCQLRFSVRPASHPAFEKVVIFDIVFKETFSTRQAAARASMRFIWRIVLTSHSKPVQTTMIASASSSAA
jgi:hypothetical protein